MGPTLTASTLNSTNVASSAQSRNPSAADDIMNDFMTLLITQIQHQDPLNPLENHELTSQIAQINTVSGIEKLDRTLQGITEQIDTAHMLQASALVGQGVLVPGNRIQLAVNEAGQVATTPFGIEVQEPADNVKVTITNASGLVVNQYDVGAVNPGVESFTWNGTNSEGQPVAEGSYRVRVEASSGDKAVASQVLNYAVVGGVTPTQSGLMLDLGAIYGQVELGDVKQIL